MVKDFVFFTIFCLFTIVILLVIEHKHKPYRPIYPVICLQLQGYIWCGLRLQLDEHFRDEFQASNIDRILYIWIMQLFSVILTLLVHIILCMKCLRKMIPIYQLYKNSSSKILLLCFVVDFELIKSVVMICITRIIKCLFVSITWIIKFLVNAIKMCISRIATKDVIKMRISNIIKVMIFFFRNILGLVVVLIFRLLAVSISNSLIGACTSLILYPFILLFNFLTYLYSEQLGFRVFGYVIFGLFLFIIFICFAYVALKSSLIPSLLNLLVTSLYLVFSSLNLLLKSLYRPSKTLFLFLIVFVPYYVIISSVLYLLVFVLPFATLKTFHILIGFFFFSFTIIGLFFLCKKSNNT